MASFSSTRRVILLCVLASAAAAGGPSSNQEPEPSWWDEEVELFSLENQERYLFIPIKRASESIGQTFSGLWSQALNRSDHGKSACDEGWANCSRCGQYDYVEAVCKCDLAAALTRVSDLEVQAAAARTEYNCLVVAVTLLFGMAFRTAI